MITVPGEKPPDSTMRTRVRQPSADQGVQFEPARRPIFCSRAATAGARPRRAFVQTVRVLGACLVGTGAELVTVEARFDRREKERTEVVITGLPDTVIRESRGRLVCALEANALHLPRGRLFLNLVPAARRKWSHGRGGPRTRWDRGT